MGSEPGETGRSIPLNPGNVRAKWTGTSRKHGKESFWLTISRIRPANLGLHNQIVLLAPDNLVGSTGIIELFYQPDGKLNEDPFLMASLVFSEHEDPCFTHPVINQDFWQGEKCPDRFEFAGKAIAMPQEILSLPRTGQYDISLRRYISAGRGRVNYQVVAFLNDNVMFDSNAQRNIDDDNIFKTDLGFPDSCNRVHLFFRIDSDTRLDFILEVKDKVTGALLKKKAFHVSSSDVKLLVLEKR